MRRVRRLSGKKVSCVRYEGGGVVESICLRMSLQEEGMAKTVIQ